MDACNIPIKTSVKTHRTLNCHTQPSVNGLILSLSVLATNRRSML